jgi:hypothetical protein
MQNLVFIEWYERSRFWGEFDQWPENERVNYAVKHTLCVLLYVFFMRIW